MRPTVAPVGRPPPRRVQCVPASMVFQMPLPGPLSRKFRAVRAFSHIAA